MSKKKGFTFVELMTVVIIIGILVGIGVPTYRSAVERSRCSFALSVLKSMRSAAIIFYQENRTFAGMTSVDLEHLAGTTFYSGGSNPHWTFNIVAADANSFTLRADRLDGPHATLFINFTSNEQFTGSTYPYQDPS